MTIATAYALKVGVLEEDNSLASIFVDARYYRDVYCPELNGKHPIGRIYSELVRDRMVYRPEVFHSSVELEPADCMEEALGAIAQAIALCQE